ncbi:MAG: SPOR domain-containing protein [Candidatus Binatia bacterium]
MKIRTWRGWGIGIAFLFSACASVKPAPPTSAFVAWSHGKPPDKRVCVLPFLDQTGREDLGEQVRRRFAGHLNVKRFADAELYELDARLSRLSKDWRTQPPSQLGKALGCDALVYGTIPKARRIYLGLYSQLTLEGAIRLVATDSDQVLVETSHTTTFHSGGMLFSPLGLLFSAVGSLQNVSETQMEKAVDDLGRTLADAVPDLPDALSAQNVASQVNGASRRYQVQIAAFRSPAQAQQTLQLLQGEGYAPTIVPVTSNDSAWHRVVVGPFPSEREAQEISRRIQASLPFTPFVTSTPIANK